MNANENGLLMPGLKVDRSQHVTIMLAIYLGMIRHSAEKTGSTEC